MHSLDVRDFVAHLRAHFQVSVAVLLDNFIGASARMDLEERLELADKKDRERQARRKKVCDRLGCWMHESIRARDDNVNRWATGDLEDWVRGDERSWTLIMSIDVRWIMWCQMVLWAAESQSTGAASAQAGQGVHRQQGPIREAAGPLPGLLITTSLLLSFLFITSARSTPSLLPSLTLPHTRSFCLPFFSSSTPSLLLLPSFRRSCICKRKQGIRRNRADRLNRAVAGPWRFWGLG